MRRPGFFGAMAYPFRGLAHLLGRPHLWRYAALPFLVNVAVYTGLAILLYLFVQDVLIGKWLAATWTWLKWAVAIVAYLAGAVLLTFSFTIVGNIIAAPLLDFLAERVLRDLRGRPLPPGRHWAVEAFSSVGRQIVKLLVFGSVQLVLLLLLLVPVANVAHPVIAALVTIFFLAVEYIEYPQAADRMPLASRFRYLFRHTGASFGFGAALFVLVLVPLLAYFALPACVVAATLLYHDLPDSP